MRVVGRKRGQAVSRQEDMSSVVAHRAGAWSPGTWQAAYPEGMETLGGSLLPQTQTSSTDTEGGGVL